MDDENQTGTSQLIILIVITLLSFIFVPRFRQLATMSEAEIAAAMQKANRIEQERQRGSDEYRKSGYEKLKQRMDEMERNKNKQEDPGNSYRQDTSSDHDSKYSTEAISSELDSFLSKYGYKQKAVGGKKLVIYSNMPRKSDDEKMERVKVFRAYSVSSDWNKKYTFIEAKFDENTMQFKSQDDYKTFLSFGVTCGYFCIVDYDNNFVYRGEKSSDSNYIYGVMADFYK